MTTKAMSNKDLLEKISALPIGDQANVIQAALEYIEDSDARAFNLREALEAAYNEMTYQETDEDSGLSDDQG